MLPDLITRTCLIWSVFLLCLRASRGLDIRFCREPLGLQSGRIPDAALTASSAFDGPSVGPQHARLNVERSGGAWCPKQQISRHVREYLEIDLSRVTVISHIATQGRYGGGRGQEYAEAFRLEYWRPALASWRPYRTLEAVETLEGNWDTRTPVHHELNPPVIASKVRVIPYGVYPRTVCMRVELFGCNFTEKLEWYSIPKGHSYSSTLNLDDKSYDGLLESKSRSQGLGMLSDGYYGVDNFKMNQGAKKGQGWIGWKNESLRSSPVELLFKFESVRNFSAVHIYANNYFSKDVQAALYFSIGGQVYPEKPLVYVYMEDLVIEKARNVSIRIPYLCAAYVKIQLWFAAKWLLISEVTFDSEDVLGDVTDESLTTSMMDVGLKTNLSWDRNPVSHDVTYSTDNLATHDFFEAVVGALSAVVLLLVLVILIIVWINYRKKSVQDSLISSSYEGNIRKIDESPNPVTVAGRIDKNEADEIRTRGWTVTTNHLSKSVDVKFSSLRADPTSAVAGYQKAEQQQEHQGVVNLRHYFPPVDHQAHKQAEFTWNIVPLREPFQTVNEKTPMEIPKGSIRLVQWLGAAPMGEVYVCNVARSNDYQNMDDDQLVYVRGGDLQNARHFQTESRVLQSLQHENLLELIGVNVTDMSGWMLFPCPVYGDLNTYLRQQPAQISMDFAVSLSLQIAQGLTYLEQQGLVHKDLAARNCLLGSGFQVKVADIAMVCAAFQDDYGEVRGRKQVPLRWLPWENLAMSKFTVASQVWMFGVTVWEILTSAREKPYGGMSDTQVILNADHLYYNDGKQVSPKQPSNCPDAFYIWLSSCWDRQENRRPTLSECTSYLSKMVEYYT